MSLWEGVAKYYAKKPKVISLIKEPKDPLLPLKRKIEEYEARYQSANNSIVRGVSKEAFSQGCNHAQNIGEKLRLLREVERELRQWS